MTKIPYILTNDSLSLVLDGRPRSISTSDKNFDRILKLLFAGASPGTIQDVLDEAGKRMQEITKLTPDMVYSGGVIVYKGEVLHNYAANRLIDMVTSGRDHTPLARFLEKLQSNPSKRVVDHLYAFLEKGKIPLTADGDFVAYKAVRHDYKDIHSGTFDNSIGSVCTMPRNRVDEDPNRTCSAGLHVCSFDYLPHFSHANGHVMMVKVNPADVVAIPADYSDTKMRVSQYVVVDEVRGYYSEHRDVLGEIGSDSGVLEPLFTLYGDGEYMLGQFYTLEEAKIQAKTAYDNYSYTEITVEDEDGMVVWTVDNIGEY